MDDEIRKSRDLLKDLQQMYLMIARDCRERDPQYSFRCFRTSERIGNAAEQMERLMPAEVELEGGGVNWWKVCGECRSAVDLRDKYCSQCGRPLIWEKTTSGNTQG